MVSSSSTSCPKTSQKLAHLPLRPSTLALFDRRGFVESSELETSKENGGMSNLAAELHVALPEAASVWREVQSVLKNTSTKTSSKTALQLLTSSNRPEGHPQYQQRQRTIVTFSRSVDDLLGGGVAKSEVTEVAGLPGVGKTQLAMQLCVNARLPTMFGGVAGESVYLDTEGSFAPERCYGMSEALVKHVHRSAQRRRCSATASSTSAVPDWFTPDTILSGIHVLRIHDEASQTAALEALPAFLQQRAQQGTPVRLVVVDSIAFHYRCTPVGADYLARTRSLTNTASILADLASHHDLAVLVTNQMTTRLSAMTATNLKQPSSKVVPALGESWAHATTTRVLLSHHHPNDNTVSKTRVCTLVKSPHKPSGRALFQVRECGIRDVHYNNTPVQQQMASVANVETASFKRQRVN